MNNFIWAEQIFIVKFQYGFILVGGELICYFCIPVAK